MVDLRSDTVTRPTPAMREAMHTAEVGDDVYGEDPTVNALEAYTAELLGHESALFLASGTQSNLVGLLSHCGRGDEYIVGESAHTYQYEGGGAAALGGIQPQTVPFATDGTLDLDRVAEKIKPIDDHFARTRLLCLENTNSGKAFGPRYLGEARQFCDRHGLALHLDGARLFNAVVAQQCAPSELAAQCDSVSVCLSKGLGAPVGSVLVGSDDFIREARHWRKMVGGGMRQAGVIAAAGLYALENHVDRLASDHDKARRVAEAATARFRGNVEQHTNMVFVNLAEPEITRLIGHLSARGIKVRGPRWVFHLDITDKDVETICRALSEL